MAECASLSDVRNRKWYYKLPRLIYRKCLVNYIKKNIKTISSKECSETFHKVTYEDYNGLLQLF